MTDGLLVLVSAPSGAGKTSLVNAALEKDDRLVVSVSHTTRSIRPGEQDGVNYHFVEANDFKRMVDNAEFLEFARVFGNQYGTARKTVQDLRAQGRDVILEIDWQGAEQIRALLPEAVSIFILPPSIAALRERLTRRAQDSQDAIEGRLAEARLEISKAPDYDFIILNESFDEALADLLAILRAERVRTAAQLAKTPVKSVLSE